jgi:hypothetical protein
MKEKGMEVHRTEHVYGRCVEAILKKRLLTFRYQGSIVWYVHTY